MFTVIITTYLSKWDAISTCNKYTIQSHHRLIAINLFVMNNCRRSLKGTYPQETKIPLEQALA